MRENNSVEPNTCFKGYACSKFFCALSPALPYRGPGVYIVYENVVNHLVCVARGMRVEAGEPPNQPCEADKQIHTHDHTRPARANRHN